MRARIGAELPGVESCIYDGIRPFSSQLGQALGELGNVLTDALLWVVDLLVYVRQLVVGLHVHRYTKLQAGMLRMAQRRNIHAPHVLSQRGLHVM